MTNDIIKAAQVLGNRVSTQDMTGFLLSLDMDIVSASTIAGRTRNNALVVGNRVVEPVRIDQQPNRTDLPPSQREVEDPEATRRAERNAVASAWAEQIDDGTTVVSVSPGEIRFDQPGTLHPEQYASVMFVPRKLEGQAGWLSRHAKHLVIVDPER